LTYANSCRALLGASNVWWRNAQVQRIARKLTHANRRSCSTHANTQHVACWCAQSEPPHPEHLPPRSCQLQGDGSFCRTKDAVARSRKGGRMTVTDCVTATIGS
jgi:hypothetical protein